MTREKAKSMLEELCDNFVSEEYQEATRIAIETIEESEKCKWHDFSVEYDVPMTYGTVICEILTTFGIREYKLCNYDVLEKVFINGPYKYKTILDNEISLMPKVTKWKHI